MSTNAWPENLQTAGETEPVRTKPGRILRILCSPKRGSLKSNAV